MSSEIAEVLAAIESLRSRGEKMALATVVAVKGSTYRRPGARALVPESGDLVGNISGGCLEGDVLQIAKDVMGEGEARLVNFDLTADDEAVWGWGLGCNGAVEVFVEPVEEAGEVAEPLRRALEEDRSIVVVTVLESDLPGVERGSRVLVHPDGSREKSLGDPRADDLAAEAALAALEKSHSVKQDLQVGEASITAFIEVLEPPPRLLICGAGHDAIPVVKHAATLGWRPIVIDEREKFLNRDRFPEAHQFVVVANPAEAAAAVGVDSRTSVIVMSHNYLRDRDYVRSFLGTDVSYIGTLGPRVRLENLLDDLAKEGVHASEADLAKMHGPAGIDIGAEGPDEIAWAILAEALAVLRGRKAAFLRERKGPIHPRRDRESSTAMGAA
ncbi:MAG: XdhC family protein [Actinomycetota bacterium]